MEMQDGDFEAREAYKLRMAQEDWDTPAGWDECLAVDADFDEFCPWRDVPLPPLD